MLDTNPVEAYSEKRVSVLYTLWSLKIESQNLTHCQSRVYIGLDIGLERAFVLTVFVCVQPIVAKLLAKEAHMGTDTATTTTAPVVELPESWSSYLTPFASALGKDVSEVTELLKSIVGDASDEAIALLKNSQMSPDVDLKAVLVGVPSAVQNRAIALLREIAPAQPAGAAVPFMDVLPDTLDDMSLLDSLRTGGVLRVGPSTVISAIRTALAYRSGLYSAPALLVKAMELFAEQNDQPVDPKEFFRVRKMLLRTNYGDVFEAIDGMDGTYVSETRKKQLLSRVDEYLWPALVGYHIQVKAWMDTWQQGSMNPVAMMSLFAGGQAGMPPSMMVPPDTSTLRDGSASFADAVNKVFAGTGVQIAAALAVEASQIKSILEDNRLPPLVGAPTKEMMIKQLGLAVSANYPRLETNLTRYALGVMKVVEIPAGVEEQQFFTALYMLGQNINWTELGTKAPTRRSDS